MHGNKSEFKDVSEDQKNEENVKTGKAMFLASDADTSTMSSALDQLESNWMSTLGLPKKLEQ